MVVFAVCTKKSKVRANQGIGLQLLNYSKLRSSDIHNFDPQQDYKTQISTYSVVQIVQLQYKVAWGRQGTQHLQSYIYISSYLIINIFNNDTSHYQETDTTQLLTGQRTD